MKSKTLSALILIILLTAVRSFSQQLQPVLIYNADKAQLTNPVTDRGKINLQSKIRLVINTNTPLSNIKNVSKIIFTGIGTQDTCTLFIADLLRLTRNNQINIIIDTNKNIETISKTVPFPINMQVIYNNVTQRATGIIGVATSPAANQNMTKQPFKAVYTGIAYFDANTIDTLLKRKNYPDIFQFMKNYYPNVSIGSRTELLNAVGDNVYLKSVFVTIPIPDPSLLPQVGATAESGIASSLLSSAGGLDVTNLADGVAQFMVKRAKDELTIAFFNRFKTYAANHPEFGILFPQTTANLSNLLAYNYTSMLPALRTGFYTDLNGIAGRLDSALAQPDCQRLFKNFPEIRVAIRSVNLADSIAKQQLSAADALNSFAHFPEFSKDSVAFSNDFKNFSNSVKLANIFSKALRDSAKTQSKSAWISGKQLTAMVKNIDTTSFNLFVGLIDIKIKNEAISFYYNNGTHDFSQFVEAAHPAVSRFTGTLEGFIKIANLVDETKTDIEFKKANHLTLTNDDFYNYINNTIDIMQYSYEMVNKLNIKNITVVSNYLPIAKIANELYRNIYQEQYSQAMLNTIDIINKTTVLVNAQPGRPKADFSKLTDDVTKYGLLIANMVNAKSSDEAEAVVESAVLPAGSSSIKKNSNINLSVQSYLGAHMITSSMPVNINSAWSDKFGISAPIGLALSYGFREWGSVTLFGSLFDLGAIVDYQLKKDSVVNTSGANKAVASKDYQVKLGQIISPGAFIVYGFGKNLPLSLGFGYQYGPGLGKINTDGTTVVNNPQGRWSIFFSVDIPFFTLINNTKRPQFSN
ncbi:MAG: hypothetical protein JWP45_1378 [Mucilaginibacter sp.]|nr:hypothetical protein [Mucilaginibacter sp.]